MPAPLCPASAGDSGAPDVPAENTTNIRPGRRVTQLDVARAAGVHNATVSLALRNSPSISEETRRRIRTIADQLGYQPDPALRALAAYRRGLAQDRRPETIAYITGGDTRWGWRDNAADAQTFAGAQRKAVECGYHVAHFWRGEPGMNSRRLGNVLFHRGITGLLIATDSADDLEPLELDWSHFCGVRIGGQLHTPALHRVSADLSGDIRTAVRRVLAAGYRRPGLVLPAAWDEAADRALSLGFLAEQARLPLERRVPILLQPGSDAVSLDAIQGMNTCVAPADFGRWLETSRPDVVLGPAAELAKLAAALGFPLGARVAFADPFGSDIEARVAGTRRNWERVGEVAVEILVSLLQQNLHGIPSIATTTLVEGSWRDGESLPTTHGAAASAEAREQTAA